MNTQPHKILASALALAIAGIAASGAAVPAFAADGRRAVDGRAEIERPLRAAARRERVELPVGAPDVDGAVLTERG